MDYKITTIPPAGRHKYGNYLSAGNISKMIVTYDNNGNGTSGVGNKEGGNKDEQPIQKNYALVLSKTTNNFDWGDVAANNGVTDIVKPIGYGDLEIIPVFVGDISIAPKDTNDVASNRNYDIKGLEKGVTIAVKGNGTSAATIEIKVDESFEGTRGTLYIPCSVYSGPENQAPYLPSYDANGNLIDDIDTASDYSDWHMARENCKTLWLEYNFNITIPVANHYTMEITNEIAAVNCDASGNILTNAVRPTCQAEMYLGSEIVKDAVYGLTIASDKEAIGVTIDTNTGVLTFGSNFSFKGSNLEIKITATKDKTTIYKIMSIVKQYPGADGSPAVIRWVVPSVNAIKFNPNTNTLTPNKISCKVMKQEGEEAPVEDTTTTIFYGYDTTNPLNQYSSEITIDASKSYIAFALKNSKGKIYEIETISIIRDGVNGEDGKNGDKGDPGRQGAAIRGPVDWKNQVTSRRWCNGILTDEEHPEDAEFIDIVVYNGVYYKCNTSYEGAGSEATAPPTEYWTVTDKQYEFVATNLLLAESAKINFTSSNELYLMGSDGNVTAGAAGGDGVNFWAGANQPSNGAFKVYNNGTMEATKGKFGMLEISVNDNQEGILKGESIQGDGAITTLEFNPEYLRMTTTLNGGNETNIIIAPDPDPDSVGAGMNSDCIDIELSNSNRDAIYTNAYIRAEGFTKYIDSHKAFSPFSPVNNFEITFVTDTNYFTKSNGYWLWKGMPLNKQYNTNTYGYVIKNSSGEWCLATSSTATDGVRTGIYTSSHIKQNNRLYIVI